MPLGTAYNEIEIIRDQEYSVPNCTVFIVDKPTSTNRLSLRDKEEFQEEEYPEVFRVINFLKSFQNATRLSPKNLFNLLGFNSPMLASFLLFGIWNLFFWNLIPRMLASR